MNQIFHGKAVCHVKSFVKVLLLWGAFMLSSEKVEGSKPQCPFSGLTGNGRSHLPAIRLQYDFGLRFFWGRWCGETLLLKP